VGGSEGAVDDGYGTDTVAGAVALGPGAGAGGSTPAPELVAIGAATLSGPSKCAGVASMHGQANRRSSSNEKSHTHHPPTQPRTTTSGCPEQVAKRIKVVTHDTNKGLEAPPHTLDPSQTGRKHSNGRVRWVGPWQSKNNKTSHKTTKLSQASFMPHCRRLVNFRGGRLAVVARRASHAFTLMFVRHIW